jgi:hypothetical protein
MIGSPRDFVESKNAGYAAGSTFPRQATNNYYSIRNVEKTQRQSLFSPALLPMNQLALNFPQRRHGAAYRPGVKTKPLC